MCRRERFYHRTFRAVMAATRMGLLPIGLVLALHASSWACACAHRDPESKSLDVGRDQSASLLETVSAADECPEEYKPSNFKCLKLRIKGKDDFRACGMASPWLTFGGFKQTCNDKQFIINRALALMKKETAEDAKFSYVLFEGVKDRNATMVSAMAAEAGFRSFLAVPTDDFTAPSADAVAAFVKQVEEAVDAGDSGVVAHCLGGMGRTGTYFAALVSRYLPVAQEQQSFDQVVLKTFEFLRPRYHCDVGEFWDPDNLPPGYDGGLFAKGRDRARGKYQGIHREKLKSLCTFSAKEDCSNLDFDRIAKHLAKDAIKCDKCAILNSMDDRVKASRMKLEKANEYLKNLKEAADKPASVQSFSGFLLKLEAWKTGRYPAAVLSDMQDVFRALQDLQILSAATGETRDDIVEEFTELALETFSKTKKQAEEAFLLISAWEGEFKNAKRVIAD